MNSAFDIAAVNYDNTFTNSNIGIMQRVVVHHFVKKILPKKPQHILEVNCGTGHDAIWLAEQGHQVLATDISNKMISIAKNKISDKANSLEFKKMDINKLESTSFPKKFDYVFSDFGGLNCLSPVELNLFFEAASKKIKPGGKIIAVIMPKNCVLETIYFLLKRDIKNAFRRNTNKAIKANVEGTLVNTWYYNPKHIENLSQKFFKIDQKNPIGICIPPSYLEPFFKNRLILLKILQKIDQVFRHFSFLSKYSDHYIISLSKT